jgi:hypothetical protein
MSLGTVIHISSQDTNKRAQFINILSKTLRDRGYSAVALLEHHIGESLACTDYDLLARAISWASELLIESRVLILVSVSIPLSEVLTKLNRYTPAIELTIDAEFMTTAPHHLSVTAEVTNLPQEITQVVLLLERITNSRQDFPIQHLVSDNVYSDQEEALLEEHLRALGYL